MFDKKPYQLILLALVLSMLMLPNGQASADVGPKPSVEFTFSYPTGQSLTPIDAQLFACKDAACRETTTLQGPPYSSPSCKADTCSATLFGSGDYLRLQVLFSDNQTRQSNPFKPSSMRNVYSVRVRQSDLLVTRNVILSNNAILGYYLTLIPITGVVLGVLALGLVAINLYIERKNRTTELTFQSAPGRYLLAWVMIVTALVAGSFLTLALPITLIIEFVVTLLYMRFVWPIRDTMRRPQGEANGSPAGIQDKRPSLSSLFRTVATVNIITQPLLWGFAITLTGSLASAFSWPILLMELGVCLVEAILIGLIQRYRLRWRDAFALGFLMNLISYSLGLLITL